MKKYLMLAAAGVLATMLAIVGFALQRSTALAYGNADQPLAQIEFSGNCNNPDFPFCAPEDQGGVGTGGIWLWIEIDAGGTGDVAGSGCGHTVGAGGPGQAGAFPINGEITWTAVSTDDPEGDYPAAVLPGAVDPNDSYYLVTIPSIGGEQFLFPATVGHYAAHPTNGVSIQIQIAP